MNKETKYRPFISADECFEEMQKHSPFGWVKDMQEGIFFNISAITNTGINYGNNNIFVRYGKITFTFADGSVFGVKEI